MSRDEGPGRVYNRRVTRHLRNLLPTRATSGTVHWFGGRQPVPAADIPGPADRGFCVLRAYVGPDGQFAVRLRRRFAHESGRGWSCVNRVRRTASVDAESLAPFHYVVDTVVTVDGDDRRTTSTVDLETLGADPLYGGREAQAAALLAEAIANRVDTAGSRYHSLANRQSLPRVVDEGTLPGLDWAGIDDLLGPDATTIAAGADVESRISDERKRAAVEKGVDFLADVDVSAADTTGRAAARAVTDDGADGSRDRPEWRTLPAGMDPERAARALAAMRRRLREMRRDG